MGALATQERIKTFLKFLDDARYECISRSGMVNIGHIGGDGSDFSVVFLAALTEATKAGEGNILTNEFKEDAVNRFMTYQHEMIVQRRHFNWNWN